MDAEAYYQWPTPDASIWLHLQLFVHSMADIVQNCMASCTHIGKTAPTKAALAI